MGCNIVLGNLPPSHPWDWQESTAGALGKMEIINEMFKLLGVISILRFNIMQQSIRVWTIYKNTPTFENIE